MNFFSFINKVIKGIGNAIKHLATKENLEKAEMVADQVSDIAAVSLTYAEKFALMTPSTADDELVAAAKKMNRTIGDILDEQDPDVRRGLILGLIGHATRAKFQEIITGAQGQKIKIGNLSVRVPDDIAKISGDLWDLAAQAAYSLFIKKRAVIDAPAS
jgi:hypothetical protein